MARLCSVFVAALLVSTACGSSDDAMSAAGGEGESTGGTSGARGGTGGTAGQASGGAGSSGTAGAGAGGAAAGTGASGGTGGGGTGGGGTGGAGGSGGAAGAMAGAGGSVPTTTMMIAPSDDHLQYVGRWDRSNAATPNTDWAGATVRFKLRGTQVRAKLRAQYQNPRILVVVDGKPGAILKPTGTAQWFDAAKDLVAGEHVVELYARSEPVHGRHEFLGLEIVGELASVPSAAHRIEVIGDSITCGYGNEAKPGEAFSSDNSNNWLAYGAVTARALAADATMIAISGRRLTDGSDASAAMPARWEGTIGADNLKWDFTRWRPEVVVINLGTNDFLAMPPPSNEAFVTRYGQFVDRIRQVYGNVPIFCTSGPMIRETATKAFVDQRRAAGDTKVFFVDFGPPASADLSGANGHPSVAEDQKMSTTLTAAIRAQTGW